MVDVIRGRYEPLEVVGDGGEGRVLKVLDRQHGRVVALKIRPAHAGAAREALLAEARTLFKIAPHPNLPVLREDFFEGDSYMLAMDWVDGVDLERQLKSRGRPGLPPTTVIAWLAGAADALTHLHNQEPSIVHADVKPANLVLTSSGHVVLVDMGISASPGRHAAGLSTPGYVAPEVAAGAAPSRASDVYALAATAFALLTGQPPTGIRPDWKGIDPPAAAALEEAIRWGLATDPARRPATPGELVEAIRSGWGSTLPTGVLTFCFTDLVESTQAWNRDPVAMAAALAKHDLLIASAVEARGGRMIKSMGEGDATVSVFTSAHAAVGAAHDAQRSLAAEQWPTAEPMRVRIALHTGEAEQRDGDYFGLTLSIAARIRAFADAHQVLVSSATAQLVRSHLPDGHTLVDIGTFSLRGLHERQPVFALDAPGLVVPRRADECPYQGLLTFDVGDAARFFGRTEVVADLTARLASGGFVAVVGSSGSGKSSVLRAGVVPAVGGATVITPGADPPPVPPGDDLLVVDQFEELFTLCRDDSARLHFVDDLLDRSGPVAIAMRADFYGSCAFHPRLARAVAAEQVLLGPMSEDELREVIVAPAASYGIHVESGLVEMLVSAIAGEPGVLPLLSHALLATWKARDGRTLTLDGYRSTGGVEGAIATTADGVLASFDPARQSLARRVLLRLVEPGDDGPDTRRKASRSEFATQGDSTVVAEVLEQLAAARLVIVGEDHVEMAHEALIREWPALREWLDEDRVALRTHRDVTVAAATWEASGRDDGDLYRSQRLVAALEWRESAPVLSDAERAFLDASARADERRAQQVASTNRRLRTMLIGVAIALVVAIVAGGLAFVQRRRADDQRAQADDQRNRADVARVAAISRSVIDRQADLGLLLAVAAQRLDATDDTRDTLLSALTAHPLLLGLLHGERSGLEAAAISPDGRTIATPTSDGTGTILWDARSHRRLRTFARERDLAFDADFSPDGRFLAVAVSDETARPAPAGRLQVWSVASGRLTELLTGPGVNLTTVEWTSDDQIVTQLGPSVSDEEPPGRVAIWDAAHWTRAPRIAVLAGTTHRDGSLAASADGMRLAMPLDDRAVGVWDVRDPGAVPNRIRPIDALGETPSDVTALAFSHGGTWIAAGTGSGSIAIFDLKGGQPASPPLRLSADVATAIAFSADEAIVAVGRADGRTQLFDRASGETLGEPLGANASTVNDLTVSDDGSILVSAGRDRTGAVWSLDGARSIGVPLAGQTGPVTEAAFGDSVLVTAGVDGTVAVRSSDDGHVERRLRPGGEVRTVSVDEQGTRIAAGGTGGSVVVWSRSGEERRRISVGSAWVHSIGFRPDGRILAIAIDASRGDMSFAFGAGTGRVRLVDPDTGRDERAPIELDSPTLSLAWSQDGSKLAVAMSGNRVAIYDVGSAPAIAASVESVDSLVVDVAFDPSGARLFGATESGVIRQWDTSTGDELAPALEGQVGIAAGVAHAADGRTVASSVLGLSTTRLWDAATGRAIGGDLVGGRTLYTARTAVIDAVLRARPAFSPDGRRLATVGFDGAATLWTLDDLRWIDAACGIAGRDLTAAEWQQFLGDRPRAAVCPSSMRP